MSILSNKIENFIKKISFKDIVYVLIICSICSNVFLALGFGGEPENKCNSS